MTRKYGNRSGKHTEPRRKIRVPDEARELIDLACSSAGVTWQEWALGNLIVQAARDLGLDPAECLDNCGASYHPPGIS